MKNKNILILGTIVALLIVGGIYWFNQEQDQAAISNDEEGRIASESEFTDVSGQPEVSEITMETGIYEVDEERSSITWQAGKPAIAGYVHTGSFSLSEGGTVTLTDSELTGEVTVDMNSLEMLSLGGGKEGQESTLERHLKGEGFFNTSEYPEATFTITDVSPKVLPGPNDSEYTATGELTMKGVTDTITFPMSVVVASENEAWMTASFDIDRTLWGINSGSASVVDRVTDQIIGDTVSLELTMLLVK